MKRNWPLLIRLIILLILGTVLGFQPRSGDVNAAFRRFRKSVGQENYQQAAESLAYAADRLPWRDDLWETSGDYARLARASKLAIRSYQQADELGELSGEGRYRLGELYLARGEAEQAVKTWEVMEQSPNAQRSLASLYTRQKRYQEAVASWQQYLEEAEAVSPSEAEEIALLFAAHDAALNLSFLEDAGVGTDPVKKMNSTLQNVREEERAYQQLVVGQTLGALGEWDLASHAIQQAIDLRPDYTEAWVYWAESLQYLEDPAVEPVRALEKAQELDPDSGLVNLFSGLYWQRQDDHQQALTYFRRAAESWPERPEVYIEQGYSHAVLGDLETALSFYQQAVEVDPQRALTYRMLASFCLEFHYRLRESALPAARQAAILGKEEPDNHIILGRVLFALGDGANALKSYYRALDPDYPPAHLYLGRVFVEREDRERAAYHLQQVLQHARNPTLISRAESLLAINDQP